MPKQVRTWERTLNRVNETLDMWYTVQRKWMYLESIFVGAEDIRLQLPEEAKKFDAIDKAFKQASILMTHTKIIVPTALYRMIQHARYYSRQLTPSDDFRR